MNTDERGWDAVFLAQSSFVVRGRHFFITGDVIEGTVRAGDRIGFTDPESELTGRTILSVETGSRTKGGRFVGLGLAPETDPAIQTLRSIEVEGLKLMIVSCH